MVSTLGPCDFRSPLHERQEHFVDDAHRVLVSADTVELQAVLEIAQEPLAFELAVPRAGLFFAPENLTCGIVTCGGLCPGQNSVIRSIVLSLTYAYRCGVSSVFAMAMRACLRAAGLNSSCSPPRFRRDYV
jgi:6-phosphofructokinase 1